MIDFSQNPLIEAAWLATHLDEPGLVLVDCRWRGDDSSPALYAAGHIPGAVHLDWHHDLGTRRGPVTDLLLPPDAFAAVMEGAGIGSNSAVLAYAETDHSGAARLWWALRYYGHDQVAILNGGISGWAAEGRPLSTEPALPRPARFFARPQAAWLATAEEIAAALERADPAVQLVDSRPAEQFAGQAVWTPFGSKYLPPGQDWVEINGQPMRAGHLPGAIHQHATRYLDPATWRYLSPEQIRQQVLDAGIRPENRVITYCGVGISASQGLFALYLAGFRNLALYDASWAEWGIDPSRPVVRQG